MNDKPHLTNLPSGLDILSAARFEHVESVYLELTVKVGGRMDDDAHFGLAHFVEHLVAHAVTKQFRTHEWISNYILQTFDASTDQEKTTYYLAAAKEDLDSCIECLARIISPQSLIEQISDSDLTREKSVVIEELSSYLDEDDTEAKLAFAQAYYGNETLARGTVLGTQESIARITLRDVKRFIDRYYRPDNAFLCVVGNLDYETLPSLIAGYLPAEATGPSSLSVNRMTQPAAEPFKRIQYDQESLQNTLVAMKRIEIDSVKNSVVLMLLAGMLGDYLEYHGRAKGWFYSLTVSYLPFIDHFDLTLECSFAPEKTAGLEAWLNEAILKFQDELTDRLFNAFRETIANNTRLELPYPRVMLDTLAWYYYYFSQLISVRDELACLEAMTLEDVTRLYAESFLPQTGTVMIAGRLDSRMTGIEQPPT
jgi:predicted Zn-dependent peptidase